MFGRWLNGVRKNDKQKIWIGVSALCWAICRSRNDIIFNKQSETNFLQVIRRAAHSIQQWVFLFPLEQRGDMVIGCNRMLEVAQDFFFQATGWRHLNRIANAYLFCLPYFHLVDSCINHKKMKYMMKLSIS
jgi:hypothetical protein